MPRSARKRGDWGMYHAMLRGINKQRIFEDDDDCRLFMQTVRHAQERCGFHLYAWCLMPNHVHLLLKEGEEPLGQIFKRIGTKYAYWYNRRYERTGHLFQDRFRSEPVEDNAGFVTVVRYIHLNPVNAGLSQTPEEYPWSSYSRYFEANTMTDPSMILGIMDREEFYRYHAENTDDHCMDIPDQEKKFLSDENVLRIMKEQWGCGEPAEFERLSGDEKIDAIRRLLKAGGSIRQVGRLTGTGVGIVRKYV